MRAAPVRCHRCKTPLAVIDWTSPGAPQAADRIIASHAIDCLPPRPVVQEPKPAPDGKPLCAVTDCGVAARAKGYCDRHYRAWRKYGHPLASARSPRASTDAPGQPIEREQVVSVRPGKEPLRCETCGIAIAADRTLPDHLLTIARRIHSRYCGRTEEEAA